jgi:nucleoside 2-deoxyribosyltransferase
MLDISGGAYFEVCVEPESNELFGSGLRAAAAVSGISKGVRLHTYVSERDRNNLLANAAGFGVQLLTHAIPKSVRFHYLHGLGTPEISPPVHMIQPANPILVNAINVLRFGFLEGEAVVSGTRVVYDPQSPYNPRPFHENKSTAKRLAYVTNLREAAILTGKNKPENMGHVLLKKHRAEVAVIKQGTLGALVVTAERTTTVPPLKTDHVWPIGSGDVFSAAFAHFWAEKKMKPVDAATRASAATAYYCNSRQLPLPRNYLARTEAFPIVNTKSSKSSKAPLIYLAGPFFTMAQRWLIDEARRSLQAQNVKVFSPLHDVGRGDAKKVVPADIDALNRCAAVFAILDGVDTGTIFEAGYARAKGIPVIAFVQNEHQDTLKMLQGTMCEITSDFVTAIYRAVWAALRI